MRMLVLAVASACWLAPTSAIHNCVLRNPERQIFGIFEEATRYVTIDGNVGAEERVRIEEQLGQRLDLGDLGKTSLCIVFKEDAPIGFVHARAEIGRYGVVELVWAANLDLTVRDFRVQRSRELQTEFLESRGFRQELIGKSWRELGLLHEASAQDSKPFPPGVEEPVEGLGKLARKSVMSGVKALLILRESALDRVPPAQQLGFTHRFFPKAERVTTVHAGPGEDLFQRVAKVLGSETRFLLAENLLVLRARKAEGEILGTLVYARCALPTEPTMDSWWAVSAGGVLEAGHVPRPMQSASIDRLVGSDLTGLQTLDLSDASRCAAEVLAVVHALDHEGD